MCHRRCRTAIVFRWGLVAGLLGIFISLPEGLWALEKKMVAVDSASNNRGNASAVRPDRIECPGILRWERCFRLFLHPGERVVDMQIEVGQRVKANDLVVRLANDALLDRLVTLEEKALTLQKAEDRMTLLSMKIDMHRRGIQRLERQIKQERQIGQEMPYYLIEGKLKDWLVLVEQKSDELAVLEAEARLLQARQPDRNRILAHLSDRTATLTEAVEALDIRAPFNGVVTQAAAGDQRAKAPDQVLEICNEDSLVVEASAWQHQIAYIRPGVAVQVFPNLFEAGAPLSGTVRSIGAAKVGSGNDRFPVFPVLIDLDQAPTDLLAGMSVSVVILLQEASRGDLP